MSRPSKYSPEDKDKAVQLARELGSFREAAAITGIGISTIRIHAQRNPAATRPAITAGIDAADTWAREFAARVLDGLDVTAAALIAGIDPDIATSRLAAVVDNLRRSTQP